MVAKSIITAAAAAVLATALMTTDAFALRGSGGFGGWGFRGPSHFRADFRDFRRDRIDLRRDRRDFRRDLRFGSAAEIRRDRREIRADRRDLRRDRRDLRRDFWRW